MGFERWGFCFGFALVVALTLMPFSAALTNPEDVMALNNLYISLGSPPLVGWIPFGGDPCGEQWQGVICVSSNITEIKLSGLNLEGTLSDTLADFASITVMDFSDNRIGGSIPSNLPATIQNFSLAGNQLTGSIPFTFSFLSQLSELSLGNNLLTGDIPDIFQQLTGLISLDMSGNNFTGQLPPSLRDLSSLKILHLHNNKLTSTLDVIADLPLLELSLSNNLLTGDIPDIFQQLTGLINLDMSGNKFTGQLPPSMRDLSSLKLLHLQNNKLTGTLDVLADLPLMDLNVENNLFSGSIPRKLLSMPNFRGDGNAFKTPIVASPPLAARPPPLAAHPPPLATLPPSLVWPPFSSGGEPWYPALGPPAVETHFSSTARKFWTTGRILLVAVVVSIVLIALVLCISVWKCCKRSYKFDVESSKNPPNYSKSSSLPTSKMEKVPREPIMKPLDGYGVDNRLDVPAVSASSNYKGENKINMTGINTNNHKLLQRPPPPPKFFPPDKAVKKQSRLPSSLNSSSYVSAFTIASLQQFTNSFSGENFIGEGLLGNVYRAELPDGKLLAVKKLNATATRRWSGDEFLDLVSWISKLKHGNILELFGYCNEHSQRLLVYEFCTNGSLYDALHLDVEMHKRLTWNVRIRVALGASRALQYLHEVCDSPVVHQNFKSSNILLDEKLAVRVADCGLAHLLPPRTTSQMAGYAAPEIESGLYTCQSDVYSLGVVMLELLTGRKSYDRNQPRGEQSLARWAIPQLHDIDALSRMVDPSLNGAYPVKSLSRFADIISRCVQMEPGFRPSISEIVQDLLHMI